LFALLGTLCSGEIHEGNVRDRLLVVVVNIVVAPLNA
jgi:hypothetical protein